MSAHGFSAEVLGRLVIDGFAKVHVGSMLAGQRQLTVRWMKITDFGHLAISDTLDRRWLSCPPMQGLPAHIAGWSFANLTCARFHQSSGGARPGQRQKGFQVDCGVNFK
jgi:hypothetical protein